MKTTIKVKHNYLSGITTYEMTWKTEYPGTKNFTLRSVLVASKDPFSTKIFKKWAMEHEIDVDALFSDPYSYKKDIKTVNELIEKFNNKYSKVFEELNSNNKCEVRYTATLNPNYKPLHTAFEVIQAYDVEVLIEYKSGVINAVFHSQGRKKNDYMPYILVSGGKMVELYEENEAIEKIKQRIEKYINDCDTDEKFVELNKKLAAVQKDLKKYM